MTRLALALIVVAAGSSAAAVTTQDHATTPRAGTVLVPVMSREPELRTSRSFRRRPLPPVSRRSSHRWQWAGLNWAAVARCESSGHWHDNTGNGYYGGLQENLAFWRNYGGLRFASRPDLATEAQQIAVAERGLKVQGRGAWPVCGRFL